MRYRNPEWFNSASVLRHKRRDNECSKEDESSYHVHFDALCSAFPARLAELIRCGVPKTHVTTSDNSPVLSAKFSGGLGSFMQLSMV